MIAERYALFSGLHLVLLELMGSVIGPCIIEPRNISKQSEARCFNSNNFESQIFEPSDKERRSVVFTFLLLLHSFVSNDQSDMTV